MKGKPQALLCFGSPGGFIALLKQFVPELCLFHSLDLQQFTLHLLSHWIIL